MHSNRPDKYKPQDVHFVCLYILHNELEFIGTISVTVEDEKKPFPFIITGYRFKRIDGVYINYFTSVQDIVPRDTIQTYCSLADWLECYIYLINQNVISARDVTIAPLLQVFDRAHFNTLMFMGDADQTLHAFIIEPRSNNLFLSPTLVYPLAKHAEEIFSKLTKLPTVKNLAFENIKLGLQGLFNDSDCGAWHICNVESIISMQIAFIANHKQFERSLKEIHLNRRDDDARLISYVAEILGDDAEFEPNEIKTLIASAINSTKSAEPTLPKANIANDQDEDLVKISDLKPQTALVASVLPQDNPAVPELLRVSARQRADTLTPFSYIEEVAFNDLELCSRKLRFQINLETEDSRCKHALLSVNIRRDTKPAAAKRRSPSPRLFPPASVLLAFDEDELAKAKDDDLDDFVIMKSDDNNNANSNNNRPSA